MEEAEAVVEEYQRILTELQDEIEELAAALETLEETGAADRHPDKHAAAEARLAEIQDEIATLEDAADGD